MHVFCYLLCSWLADSTDKLVCRYAWFLYLFYMGSLGYYLYVRITKTLDLGPSFMWCDPGSFTSVQQPKHAAGLASQDAADAGDEHKKWPACPRPTRRSVRRAPCANDS